VFQQYFPSILYRFDGIYGFPLVESGGMSILVAKGRPEPEMTPLSDYLTRVCDRLAVEMLRLSLTVQKLFDFTE
jgi:hypothetical protein